MSKATPPQPEATFWDTLPQIVGKLKNEFLLVTLGIFILVIATGLFAPGIVDSLGRGFFYLLVVLAWLAYIIGRVLTAWLKVRQAKPPAGSGEPQVRTPAGGLGTTQADHSSAAANDRGIAPIGNNNVSISGDVRGDVLGPGAIKTEQHYHTTPPSDPTALRTAYLNYLYETVGDLSLSGVDPKAASETETRLSLGAVYTALLTLTPEEREMMQKEPRAIPSGRRAERRLSALAHLDRQPRLVLLGDPGSGKSTFVNFVALCLAGETLGRTEANLDRLTEPLPPDDEDDEKEAPLQPWRHGPLLPVRVVLRDFAARGLPPAGQKATARHLEAFIGAELEAHALGDYVPHLLRELRERGGLLLLDGLDEVPEADRRREQIKQAVEDWARAFPRCRVLVTSRTYAYQQQAWRLPRFAEAVLAPFSAGQIRRFVDRWYAHIAQLRGLHADDAQGRAELLKRAIFGSDRLRSLAERPLLLTLMASLHAWRGGSLPEKREELYADAVDLLLDWWERPKVVRDARGRVVVQQPSLAEWLRVDRARVRALLEELAYKAHAAQPDTVGTADVPEGELLSGLLRLSQNPDVNPARLVRYLSQRAGLLLPRGVGVYTFPHRTFQEYLAACYLTDHDYPEQVAELARRDPNRWREVALLAGAKSARGSDFALWALVEALCYRDVGPDEALSEKDAWGALLAGQMLAESGNLGGVSERNRPKLERVRSHLVRVLRADGLAGRPALPPVERAAAGHVLARLGDPRFDPAHASLPAEPLLGFVRIPAGPFLMGSDDEDDMADSDEKPQHELDLAEYYIARWPVTAAQWRAFVQASGHEPENPRSLRDPDNHPVRWVSWYEAVKYCEWLTEQMGQWANEQIGGLTDEEREFWRRIGQEGWRVMLPSEAEWEKAARGPNPQFPNSQFPNSQSTNDRRYPWGDEFDPNRANTYETGIGDTSAVGCFPGGASPYGVEDLSGNVWEWTRSPWRGFPYEGDGRERLDDNAPRVLRGGSFLSDQGGARCSVRLRNIPNFHWYISGLRLVVAPVLPSSGPLVSGL